MKNLLISVTLLRLVVEGGALTVGRWNNDLLESEVPSIRDECLGGICMLYAGKRNSVAEETMSRYTPWHYCSCETQYEIMDLGDGHYPRYLTTARCKSKACLNKFNQCKLLSYRVHVLKQRDTNTGSESMDEQYIDESPLPESLRGKWQLSPMTIAVACSTADRKRH